MAINHAPHLDGSFAPHLGRSERHLSCSKTDYVAYTAAHG
jgi:hypothetical protein